MYLNDKGNIPLRSGLRLTLTWDVFKLYTGLFIYSPVFLWLTLTWDVFKLNRGVKTSADLYGLTLTWDVFKF